jgi:hypothetical protein
VRFGIKQMRFYRKSEAEETLMHALFVGCPAKRAFFIFEAVGCGIFVILFSYRLQKKQRFSVRKNQAAVWGRKSV